MIWGWGPYGQNPEYKQQMSGNIMKQFQEHKTELEVWFSFKAVESINMTHEDIIYKMKQ